MFKFIQKWAFNKLFDYGSKLTKKTKNTLDDDIVLAAKKELAPVIDGMSIKISLMNLVQAVVQAMVNHVKKSKNETIIAYLKAIKKIIDGVKI